MIIRDPLLEWGVGHTQSNHGISSASMYISSHPVTDSGTFLIRATHTHRCTRFSDPPTIRADIFEDGKESVSGSISTWNMISVGRLTTLSTSFSKKELRGCGWTHFCHIVFFLTVRFVGVDLLGVEPPPFFSAWRRLSTNGVPNGGGFLSLAASQSKGVEEEMEGVADGGVEIL